MPPVSQAHGGSAAKLFREFSENPDTADERVQSQPDGHHKPSNPAGSTTKGYRSLRQQTLEPFMSPFANVTLGNSTSVAGLASPRSSAPAPFSTVVIAPSNFPDAVRASGPPVKRRLNLSTPPKPQRKSTAHDKTHAKVPRSARCLYAAPAATPGCGLGFSEENPMTSSYGFRALRGTAYADAEVGSRGADGAVGSSPATAAPPADAAAHVYVREDRDGGDDDNGDGALSKHSSEPSPRLELILDVQQVAGDTKRQLTDCEEQQDESAGPTQDERVEEEEEAYGRPVRARGRTEPQTVHLAAAGRLVQSAEALKPAPAAARCLWELEPGPKPGTLQGASARSGAVRGVWGRINGSESGSSNAERCSDSDSGSEDESALEDDREDFGEDPVIGGLRGRRRGPGGDLQSRRHMARQGVKRDTVARRAAGDGRRGAAEDDALHGHGGNGRPVRAAAAKAMQKMKMGADAGLRGCLSGPAVGFDTANTCPAASCNAGGTGAVGGGSLGQASESLDAAAMANDAAAMAGAAAAIHDWDDHDNAPERDNATGSKGRGARGDRRAGGAAAAAFAHSSCSGVVLPEASSAAGTSSGHAASFGAQGDQEDWEQQQRERRPSRPEWNSRRPGYVELSAAVAYRRACQAGAVEEATAGQPRCWGVGLLGKKPVMCNTVLHGSAALVFQSAIKAALQGRLGRLQDQKVVRVLNHERLTYKELKLLQHELEERLRRAAAERMATAPMTAGGGGGGSGEAEGAGGGGGHASRDWRSLTNAEILEHLPELIPPSSKVEQVILGEEPEDPHPWQDVEDMNGQASLRVRPGCKLHAGEFIGLYSAEGWLHPDWQAQVLADPLEEWDDPEHPCPYAFSAARKHDFGRYAADCSLPDALLKQLHHLNLDDEKLLLRLGDEPENCGKVFVTAARLGCLVAAANDPRRNLRALCEGEADFRQGGPNAAVVTAVILGILPVLVMVATAVINGPQHVMYSYGHAYWELHEEEQAVCRDMEAVRQQARRAVQAACSREAKYRNRRHELKAELKKLQKEVEKARKEVEAGWQREEAARAREEEARKEAEKVREEAEVARQREAAVRKELEAARAEVAAALQREQEERRLRREAQAQLDGQQWWDAQEEHQQWTAPVEEEREEEEPAVQHRAEEAVRKQEEEERQRRLLEAEEKETVARQRAAAERQWLEAVEAGLQKMMRRPHTNLPLRLQQCQAGPPQQDTGHLAHPSAQQGRANHPSPPSPQQRPGLQPQQCGTLADPPAPSTDAMLDEASDRAAAVYSAAAATVPPCTPGAGGEGAGGGGLPQLPCSPLGKRTRPDAAALPVADLGSPTARPRTASAEGLPSGRRFSRLSTIRRVQDRLLTPESAGGSVGGAAGCRGVAATPQGDPPLSQHRLGGPGAGTALGQAHPPGRGGVAGGSGSAGGRPDLVPAAAAAIQTQQPEQHGRVRTPRRQSGRVQEEGLCAGRQPHHQGIAGQLLRGPAGRQPPTQPQPPCHTQGRVVVVNLVSDDDSD